LPAWIPPRRERAAGIAQRAKYHDVRSVQGHTQGLAREVESGAKLY